MGMQERKEDRALPKQRFLRIEIQYEASRGSTAGPTCMHTQHTHTQEALSGLGGLKKKKRAGEMTQRLRALTALAEHPGLVSTRSRCRLTLWL